MPTTADTGFPPKVLKYENFAANAAAIAGVVITLFVTLVATPIRTYLFGGVTGSGADFFVAYLTAVGQKLLQSVALTVIWTNLVDKIVACLVAQAVVRQLPERIRSLFPGAGNVA